MLFEMFAVTGGTPKNSSVGKVMRVPDPTIVLIVPAADAGEDHGRASPTDTRSP